MIPALKKGRVKSRIVCQPAIFPAGAARLNEKVRSAWSVRPALRLRAWLPSATCWMPPAVIVSARYRITAGKMPDFQNLVKSEILPNAKFTGIRNVVETVTRRRLADLCF
jgi:hypothetical protein